MSSLVTGLNIVLPDKLYAKLIGMHEGLSDFDVMKTDAKLILLLANHVGDERIVEQAIAIASKKKTQSKTTS